MTQAERHRDAKLCELMEAVASRTFTFASESELQAALAEVLSPLGAVREVDIAGAGRVDFLTACGVAVEVKIDGSISQVSRQVMGYIQSPIVAALLVVSTRRSHAALHGQRLGKPVRVVVLDGGLG